MNKKVKSLRNEQIKFAIEAYNNNKENFESELKRLFKANEYITNNDSTVKVRGYLDDNGIAYFQFQIDVIGEILDTTFYRYDYCVENQNTIDVLELYELEDVEILQLQTYTNKDLWFYSN